VRRAETSGDEAQFGLHAVTQRRGELVGVVPDDDHARGIESALRELTGQERAVRVAAAAADELCSGDDDDGTRGVRQWLGRW
jgi:hypothetical protein